MKAIVSATSTTKNIENITDSPILVCPTCLTQIPLLSWQMQNGKVYIQIDYPDCVNDVMEFDDYLKSVNKQTSSKTFAQ